MIPKEMEKIYLQKKTHFSQIHCLCLKGEKTSPAKQMQTVDGPHATKRALAKHKAKLSGHLRQIRVQINSKKIGRCIEVKVRGRASLGDTGPYSQPLGS